MTPKRSRSTRGKTSSAPPLSPPVARTDGCLLRSATLGPLPLVTRLLRRMRLEEFLRDALPREDGRTKLSPTKALLVLLRNLLLSREPIYGVGEDRRGGERDRPLLDQHAAGHHRRRLPAGVVSQPTEGRTRRHGPSRPHRTGAERTGDASRQAALAADPLSAACQGGTGRGRNPRLLRGRGVDRHARRAENRGNVSSGPPWAAQ